MPELPEVETVRRDIESYIINQTIMQTVVRVSNLRWPIQKNLAQKLNHQIIRSVGRRGKYLLLSVGNGTLIIHLGMSGSLQLLAQKCSAKKHDHVDIVFASGFCLRFNDPRRFGAILWTEDDPNQHKLLAKIGPEPLTPKFNGEYLYQRSRNRKIAIKSFIMNSNIVAGIGNVYANEALFMAGINPCCAAGKISKQHYNLLANSIKKVLNSAINNKGTTLRDFISANGEAGRFAFKLKVYGKAGQPCPKCKTPIKLIRLSQRSTYYCPYCQS